MQRYVKEDLRLASRMDNTVATVRSSGEDSETVEVQRDWLLRMLRDHAQAAESLRYWIRRKHWLAGEHYVTIRRSPGCGCAFDLPQALIEGDVSRWGGYRVFARDVLGIRLKRWQEDVLDALCRERDQGDDGAASTPDGGLQS